MSRGDWNPGPTQSLRLVFTWRERDGPAVSEPARRGFGSELLQRQLRYELNGNATMDFHPDGLRVELEIPARGTVAE